MTHFFFILVIAKIPGYYSIPVSHNVLNLDPNPLSSLSGDLLRRILSDQVILACVFPFFFNAEVI